MLRRIASRVRLIRIHRTYTTNALATLLGVHVQTVRTWVKKGLKPIAPDKLPLRLQGETAKKFLRNYRKQAKHKLGADEYYCNRCKAPRRSNPVDLGFAAYRREIAPGKHFIIRTGKCEICGCKLSRFATVNEQSNTPTNATLKYAELRLEDNSSTPVNINSKE